jgi:hypothetical protein
LTYEQIARKTGLTRYRIGLIQGRKPKPRTVTPDPPELAKCPLPDWLVGTAWQYQPSAREEREATKIIYERARILRENRPPTSTLHPKPSAPYTIPEVDDSNCFANNKATMRDRAASWPDSGV